MKPVKQTIRKNSFPQVGVMHRCVKATPPCSLSPVGRKQRHSPHVAALRFVCGDVCEALGHRTFLMANGCDDGHAMAAR